MTEKEKRTPFEPNLQGVVVELKLDGLRNVLKEENFEKDELKNRNNKKVWNLEKKIAATNTLWCLFSVYNLRDLVGIGSRGSL